MPAAPGLPELVIFDVDGTLQDTSQWWPGVIAEGVTRYGKVIGRDLPLPDAAAANAVLGHKDEQVWGPFLPDDLRSRWKELREVTIPLEIDQLRAGRDWLFPGTRPMLRELRAAGVRLALASNCRSRYFTAVREGQGLGELVDAAFCLDTPGVSCKRDMVAQALAQAGTRRAVMVGDRRVDEDAATFHGIPFVLRHGPHAGEVLAPVATFAASAELIPLLAGRGPLVRALAERLAATRPAPGRALRVGITGPPCAGKTELVAELRPLLSGWRVAALDQCLRPRPDPALLAQGDHLGAAFDLPRWLQTELKRDADGAPVLVEGLFLLDPRVRPHLDVVVFVDAPEDQLLVRAAGRAPGLEEQLRTRFLPAHREFIARHPPRALAQVQIDNANLLRPRLLS